MKSNSKAKSFENILRKIIREELSSVIKREFELLTEGLRNTEEVEKPLNGSSLYSLLEEDNTIEQNVVAPKRKPTIALKNKVLQDLINDTSPIPGGGLASDFVNPSAQATVPVTDINNKPVNLQNEAIRDTLDIINRDYSGLMSTIEKSKK